MKTFAQGEIYGRKIEALPDGLSKFTERCEDGAWLISHSESGNHHVIDSAGVAIMERADGVPDGLRILYAIVDQPTKLRQDAGANAHESHDLDAGFYEIRIAREYDPFLKQARRVAD